MQKMITIEFDSGTSQSNIESKYNGLNKLLAEGWVVDKISPMGISGNCQGNWQSKTILILSKEE